MLESLRTVVLQELKARFPAMTWKLGSISRELVVEPIAALGDIFVKYVQTAENGLDVQTICQAPAQHMDEIDTWMSRLGLEYPDSKNATGIVAILSETGESMEIPAGTSFSWGDQLSFQSTETRRFGSDTQYTKLNEGAYLAEVPVVSLGESGASLSSGTPLNWEGAPAHVYDIYTASSITGGSAAMSYQARASLIMNALSVKTFVGDDGISHALQRAFPQEIVNARSVGKDAKKPYTVPLFVKPSSPPSTFIIASATEKTSDNITVTFPGAGILSIDRVIDSENHIIPITNTEVIDGDIGDSDSKIVLTLSGVGVGEAVSVYCTGFKILQECAYWLNAENQGLPFVYVVKTPAVAIITLALNVQEDIPTSVKNDIQAYINDKPLDASITDGEIISILSKANINSNGANFYSAYIVNNDGINAVIPSTGGIAPSGNYWANGRPVAMYSYTDKITSNV